MEHTDKKFEQDLRGLKDEILKMGGIVEEMIARSMKSLIERDSRIVGEVTLQEGTANRLEMEIDDRCLQLLALRQPTASDLRFITIGLKISKDLERIGDHATNIAETVHYEITGDDMVGERPRALPGAEDETSTPNLTTNSH